MRCDDDYEWLSSISIGGSGRGLFKDIWSKIVKKIVKNLREYVFYLPPLRYGTSPVQSIPPFR